MQPIAINENTWRIEDCFVRSFLLAGTEKALLIDTGASSSDARAIAETLTDLPVILVNTHGDGDHTAGNGCFSSFYITEADYTGCGMAAKYPNSTMISLTDGDIFDLGGRTISVIAIPGHTLGSVALLDNENRMLFSGDSVQTEHIFMFGIHRAPEVFAESLAKLMTYTDRFDKIYPSHGQPELPADYVGKVLAAWQAVCSGQAECRTENMFGNMINSYTLDCCGFFCTPKAEK